MVIYLDSQCFKAKTIAKQYKKGMPVKTPPWFRFKIAFRKT